jgi:hypothetical protein
MMGHFFFLICREEKSQLPGGDQPDPPDPYVKLYLLPDRSTNSKRKTEVRQLRVVLFI